MKIQKIKRGRKKTDLYVLCIRILIFVFWRARGISKPRNGAMLIGKWNLVKNDLWAGPELNMSVNALLIDIGPSFLV